MKVLLAEDDAVTRLMTAGVIRQCGHDVAVAVDGAEALELFLRDPAPVLVLDWQMPGMDGLEVCRRIRATPEGREAFVLMLSARDAIGDLTAAIDAGVDDYVAKPLSRDQIAFRLVIAERRAAINAARRRAEQELEEVRWAAGASDTIVALQHEINNPLAALLTTLELASEPGAPPAEQAQTIDTALQLTRRVVGVMRKVSELRQHRRTEYVPGVPMLDVHDQ